MRRAVAIAQTSLEGLRWIRDAELNGDAFELLKNRHFSEAALLAVRGLARAMPGVDVKTFVPRLLEEQHEYLGMGAETIAVRDGTLVHKYVTGKSQKPDLLALRLWHMQQSAEAHLGEFHAPTSIEVVRAKLFKGLPATRYVCLTQPYFEIEHTDPHLQPELLKAQPEIMKSLGELSQRLGDLFEHEGLLMDIVNRGNLVWGKYGDDQPNKLYIIDTLPVDFASKNFTGIKVPLWNPGMYMQALADFIIEFNLDESTTSFIENIEFS